MRKFRSFVKNVSLVPVAVPEEGDSLRNVIHLILHILCLSSVTLLISVVVYEWEADGCTECVPLCILLNSFSCRALFTNSLAGKCDSVGERQ